MKPFYKTIILFLGLILITVLIYVTKTTLIGNKQDFNQEAEHSLSGITEIRVENLYEDIRLHTIDQKDVFAYHKGTIDSKDTYNIPILDMSYEDQVLYVFVKYNEGAHKLLTNTQFDLYLPKDYAFDIHILSNDGDIDIPPLKTNLISATTTLGDITFVNQDNTSINLSTIRGKIEVTLNQPSSRSVFAQTKEGNLVSSYPNNSDSRFHFISTFGDIVIK